MPKVVRLKHLCCGLSVLCTLVYLTLTAALQLGRGVKLSFVLLSRSTSLVVPASYCSVIEYFCKAAEKE